jgi:hypothetical protein
MYGFYLTHPRINTFVTYDILMYKTVLNKKCLSILNVQKHVQTIDNNRELMFSNIKLYTHEDDIVEVETCGVNSQPKCVVSDSV